MAKQQATPFPHEMVDEVFDAMQGAAKAKGCSIGEHGWEKTKSGSLLVTIEVLPPGPHEFWCGHCGARDGPFPSEAAANDAMNAHGRAHVAAEREANFMALVLKRGARLSYRVYCKPAEKVGAWMTDEAEARRDLAEFRSANPQHANAAHLSARAAGPLDLVEA